MFTPKPLLAQDPPYINYSEQNGLSTSVVYGLFQDSEDNIWFCTNMGAVKFNGNKLTSYGKKDGLPGNEVFKIFEDSYHRLWFMTASGNIAFYKNQKIYNAVHYPVFAKIKPGSFISDIREDAGKRIWIIPDKGNLFSIAADLGSFEEIPSSASTSIFFNYKDSNYISTRQGIYAVGKQLTKVAFSNYDSSIAAPRHFYSDRRVYVARNKRVEVYDMDRKTMSAINSPELPDNFNAVVMIDSLLYLCSPNGLSIYNSTNYSKAGQYFNSLNISHVLKDKEGSLWLATLNNGVLYIPNMRVNFLRSSEYFQNNKILKLGGLGDHLIIGQSKSKTTYYHKGNFTPINSPYKSAGGEGLTYFINTNAADSSFLISNQSGLTHFYLNKNIVFQKNMAILGFARSDSDSIFVSSPSNIYKFGRQFRESYFYEMSTKFVMDKIRAQVLCFDPVDSVLYAGTKGGLVLYKHRKRMPPRFSMLNGLDYTDIEKNKQNFIIAATMGDGIFFFNKDTCVQVNEKSGLSDNMCSSLFIQNDSTVWVTTLHGLNRINCRYVAGTFKFQVKNFYRNDGLPSNYINDIYIYNDSIWLATNTGLAIFKEKDLYNYTYTQKIAIDAFKANGHEIDHTGVISLDRQSNNVVIEFNCRTFKNAGAVFYKYRLVGLNSNWVETKNNQVDFTALAPGKYTFEVYAYSLNESWKTNTGQLRFNIEPAFWQTLWFRILATLLFVLIAVLVIFRQFRKVKNKFTLQEKIISYEKELLELEQQALRLQMNPHFIFNAMNSIQHAILSGKQNDAYNSLELFSSLIRGILENSKHKFISLEDEIEILKIYIEIEAKRFSSDFAYEVTIDPEIDMGAVKIPPMLIQPFVENSIWHGLMPKTDGEKKLILAFTQTDMCIICRVEDNGIGRHKAAVTENKKHTTSMGTALTFNRISNINVLEKRTKYAIDIFDKANDAGTIVTITILR